MPVRDWIIKDIGTYHRSVKDSATSYLPNRITVYYVDVFLLKTLDVPFMNIQQAIVLLSVVWSIRKCQHLNRITVHHLYVDVFLLKTFDSPHEHSAGNSIAISRLVNP